MYDFLPETTHYVKDLNTLFTRNREQIQKTNIIIKLIHFMFHLEFKCKSMHLYRIKYCST